MRHDLGTESGVGTRFVSTGGVGGGMVHVMSGPELLGMKKRVVPLDGGQRARCLRVVARLHSDLGVLVGMLPEHARGGSGMSRHLGVVRNTCQRVAYALGDVDPDLDTLMKLPGTKGLHQLLDAMGEKGIDGARIEIGRAAVVEYEGLIRDAGGSHAKLCARIEAGDGVEGGGGLGDVGARKALYEAAVGITGRMAKTTISLYAFRGVGGIGEGDGGVLQRAVATGLIGTTVVPGGMPVVISNGNTLKWDDDLEQALRNLDDSVASGATPEALLRDFCSEPLPTVTTRGDQRGVIRVIDPAGLDGPKTFDVVSAARSNHPMFDQVGDPVFNEIWSLANCPSERLVFDVYVHEEMEREYRPSIDAQQWNPNLSAPGGDKWVLRYPAVPSLEMLGRGIGQAGVEGYGRHGELTEAFFERMGWDPEAFFGYRCSVEYPIWRGGYCMKFARVGGGAGA